MTKMIPIPSDLNEGKTVRIRGILTRASLSPQDFPKDAEVSFDPKSKEFSVRFRYEGGEETTEVCFQNEHVVLRAGKTSGRLFRIVVKNIENPEDIPNIAINAVIQIQQQKEQSEHDYPTMQILNFNVARAFLEKNRGQLVA